MGWREAMTGFWRRWFPTPPLGQRGETAAARFLQRQGYKIVARQQENRLGEIDIVAVDGRTVVFVEVKTRASAGESPEEAVGDQKQRRLTRLALSYLRSHGLLEYAARFDVVAVTWPEGRRRPTIEHFKDAFSSPGSGSMFG